MGMRGEEEADDCTDAVDAVDGEELLENWKIDLRLFPFKTGAVCGAKCESDEWKCCGCNPIGDR